MYPPNNDKELMDAQLRLDLQGILQRTYKSGYNAGRSQTAAAISFPLLLIAVAAFAAGFMLGVTMP